MEKRNFCAIIFAQNAVVAQLVEHSHGKGEVIGSIPIIGSTIPYATLAQLVERRYRKP